MSPSSYEVGRLPCQHPQQLESDTSKTVILHFAGDCALTDHFEEYVGERLDYPFQKASWFSQADITMVNLENAVTTATSKIKKDFNFRMHPKYLRVLQEGGIDIVTLANNHTYDYGAEGLLQTIRLLDSIGVKHVGAGRNLVEATRPAVFDIKGIRVGFLGYFGSGTFAATEASPGVAPRNLPLIKRGIADLKENWKADYIVVNFHWGEEKAVYPSEWQMRLAHDVVDAGADLVVGHHPHVLQGIEKHGQGVIAYSLGNFLFGGNRRSTYDTAILRVELNKGTRRVSLIPVRVEDWQVRALQGDEADRVLESVRRLSDRFDESIFPTTE